MEETVFVYLFIFLFVVKAVPKREMGDIKKSGSP